MADRFDPAPEDLRALRKEYLMGAREAELVLRGRALRKACKRIATGAPIARDIFLAIINDHYPPDPDAGTEGGKS